MPLTAADKTWESIASLWLKEHNLGQKGGWGGMGTSAAGPLHPIHFTGTPSTCQSKKSWLRAWPWTGPVGR